MLDIMNVNLYELIGTIPTASVEQIETAYRRKALLCDPDKNPNNPQAAELFRELNEALQILINETLRASYDKYFYSQHQVIAEQHRRQAQLEFEEQQFQENRAAQREARRRSLEKEFYAEMAKTIEQSGPIEEEIQLMNKNLNEELVGIKKVYTKLEGATVVIKWNVANAGTENGGYNYEKLYRLLSKYGEIIALVVFGEKGRGMVEYRNKSDAIRAIQMEALRYPNQLSLRGLWESGDAENTKLTKQMNNEDNDDDLKEEKNSQ